MGSQHFLETLINSLITITLATTFLIIGGRRVESAIKVLVAQALLLTAVTAVVGKATALPEIYVAALLTVIVKGIIIPYVLRTVVDRIGTCREVKSYVTMKMSFVSCAGLVMVSYYVTGEVIGTGPVMAGSALPVAISMMLIGLFLMITRKLAIMQVIGLLVMENGLFLAGVATTHGMPLVVELGIFMDVMVGVLIMGILTFRINRSFDSIDTEKLKNLRG